MYAMGHVPFHFIPLRSAPLRLSPPFAPPARPPSSLAHSTPQPVYPPAQEWLRCGPALLNTEQAYGHPGCDGPQNRPFPWLGPLDAPS